VNRTEHLLVCLAEECAEVSQRVSKALRFGLAEVQPGQPLNNAERIAGELDDLFAVARILADEGILPREGPDGAEVVEGKRAKIERCMAISREQGVLLP
jgi:NTP pyrophosphatase (non-canonical NTP hydrolase)